MLKSDTVSTRSRTYRIGPSKLNLIFGDLTASQSEVLVSSDDYMLTMGGGISAALRRKAGESLVTDAVKKIPARLGDVIVTTAGALPAKHIFHAITIGDDPRGLSSKAVITLTTRRCLELTETLSIRSIAFPAIGAGAAGFPYSDVAVHMAEVVTGYLTSSKSAIEVSIYLFDRFRQMHPIDFVHFFEEFAARTRNLPAPEPSEPVASEGPKVDDSPPLSPRQEITSGLSQLTQERDDIESKLAEFRDSLHQSNIEELESQLTRIHEQRLQLLGQLHDKHPNGMSAFISYSHKDQDYLNDFLVFLKSLERQSLITSWFDRKITAGTEWRGQIDKHLETSDIILLLISADFINSDYCFDIELTRAMERHTAHEALVIPISIRPAIWDDLPFAKIQSLPTNLTPVATWSNQDSAWVDVTRGIRDAISAFTKQQFRPRHE